MVCDHAPFDWKTLQESTSQSESPQERRTLTLVTSKVARTPLLGPRLLRGGREEQPQTEKRGLRYPSLPLRLQVGPWENPQTSNSTKSALSRFMGPYGLVLGTVNFTAILVR